MKTQKLFISTVAIAVLLLGLTAGLAAAQAPDADPAGVTAVALGTAASTPLSTSFTYQGQLIKDGVPANGSCDIRFILYESGAGGSQVGPIVEKLAATVTGGLFTVPDLDFGGGVFVGDRRWLEVAVKCPAGSGSYATVGNRQELTATPYALYATNNWGLGGNTGTTPGTNYLGTSDDQALELKVNGQRALRIEPNATSPNLIGGYSGNAVDAGIYGATIGGGGASNSSFTCGITAQPCWNRVLGNLGTVGGGAANTASHYAATVGGGYHNTASRYAATVGGGYYNTASGYEATVGGGYYNTASGYYTTVGGGYFNTASGDYSFAAGRQAKANTQGSFIWADSTAVDFVSAASNEFAARAGGGVRLVVGSGALRIEPNATSPNLIGGYSGNTVTDGAYGATVDGGGDSGGANRVTDAYGTVGGGRDNWAGDNAGTVTDREYATIGGGYGNTAGGSAATVGGGYANSAGGWRGAVAGGEGNSAAGDHGFTGGGWANKADGAFATVAGGRDNWATGQYAAVPGGQNTTAAGNFSFAAGHNAKATHAGSFVWGDATDVVFASAADNQFRARTSGGVYFYTKSDLSTGVHVAADGGAWNSVSDRNAKENFTAVNGQELLDQLAQVPITTWNYKGQDAAIRHIGPVAQDFYAAFGVGEDDTHISTLDPDGVALAASQALVHPGAGAGGPDHHTAGRERGLEGGGCRPTAGERRPGCATGGTRNAGRRHLGATCGALGFPGSGGRRAGRGHDPDPPGRCAMNARRRDWLPWAGLVLAALVLFSTSVVAGKGSDSSLSFDVAQSRPAVASAPCGRGLCRMISHLSPLHCAQDRL